MFKGEAFDDILVDAGSVNTLFHITDVDENVFLLYLLVFS